MHPTNNNTTDFEFTFGLMGYFEAPPVEIVEVILNEKGLTEEE